MAFVPPYACDIFVSYAHVDDRPAPGTNTGWVTTLVQGLTWYLAQKLGRSDAFILWMDHELAGNVPLTPEITAKLHNSATMVLIWSPGYVASAWCQRELDTFLGRLRERPHVHSSVFIVERGPRAQEQQPSALQDLLGYKFWAVDRPGRPPRILGSPQPNPADTRYYDLLNDLSTDLAETLQRLKNAATREQDIEGTVFLAEVTDDLDSQRDEVRRYLVQAGLYVVPDTWYSPREPSAFQQALDDDLARSALFVQLLSEVKPQGDTYLQYERAKALGKPIMQWRSPELDLALIQDENSRAFLETETVFATRLEEFERTIVQRVKRFVVDSPPRQTLFVDVGEEDKPLAQKVIEFLVRHGIDSDVPLSEGPPAEVRKDFEQKLRHCDGLLVVYGGLPVPWLLQQMRYCYKQQVFRRRDRPLKVFAVYNGPPALKAPLGVTIPGLHIVDGRHGLNEAALLTLLERLRG